MTTKPQLPRRMFDAWERIPVDETEGGPFARILRAGALAADDWTLGPDGPYKNPGMAGAQATQGGLREALLHLLELGLIGIDEERLDAAPGIPCRRRDMREPVARTIGDNPLIGQYAAGNPEGAT